MEQSNTKPRRMANPAINSSGYDKSPHRKSESMERKQTTGPIRWPYRTPPTSSYRTIQHRLVALHQRLRTHRMEGDTKEASQRVPVEKIAQTLVKIANHKTLANLVGYVEIQKWYTTHTVKFKYHEFYIPTNYRNSKRTGTWT